MSTADTILSRLTGIRQTAANKWLARCPTHDDGSPSLSIRTIEDGRTLVYCFAGCRTEDVLAAVGLGWGDLYPPRDPGPITSRSRPWHATYSASDLLQIASEEVSVVAIIAVDMLSNKSISDADWQRLSTAAHRIHRVRDNSHG